MNIVLIDIIRQNKSDTKRLKTSYAGLRYAITLTKQLLERKIEYDINMLLVGIYQYVGTYRLFLTLHSTNTYFHS